MVPAVRKFAVVASTLTIAATFAGCSEEAVDGSADDASTTSAVVEGTLAPQEGDGSLVSRYAGADWFAGTVPDTATPADASKPPLKVGVISSDEGPIAALPELHEGIDAAVSFINDELGGVGGRPIETVFCPVDISAEKAQQCARTLAAEGVEAVLPGVVLASGDAIAVLEENEIPWIGGIPVGFDEMNSPMSFQFSGGSPGAFVAFADHAVNEVKAEKASIMYINLDQISLAVDYAKDVLEAGGVEVAEVPFDITTQDYAGVARKAAEGDPDAIIVGAADFACPKVMQAIADLDSDATTYLVGACADRKWLDQLTPDALDGRIFNVEGPVDPTLGLPADVALYNDALARYQPATSARGAATVSFRGVMNFWAVASAIEGEVTRESIVEAFRAAKDEPSFNGHAFTCDGEQMPDLASICAPQQILITPLGNNEYEQLTDWIDVPAVIDAARQ